MHKVSCVTSIFWLCNEHRHYHHRRIRCCCRHVSSCRPVFAVLISVTLVGIHVVGRRRVLRWSRVIEAVVSYGKSSIQNAVYFFRGGNSVHDARCTPLVVESCDESDPPAKARYICCRFVVEKCGHSNALGGILDETKVVGVSGVFHGIFHLFRHHL